MNTTIIVWWAEAISFTHCSNISSSYRNFTHNQHEEYIDCTLHTHTRTQLLIAHTKNKILERHQARSCSLLCRLFNFLSFTHCFLRPKPHNIPLLSTCNLQIATKIVYRICGFFLFFFSVYSYLFLSVIERSSIKYFLANDFPTAQILFQILHPISF